MSIQAVAWALEQDLPARPKLVLVSIANHADHTTGYCWLKAETIAAEAACSPRAVFNFVGDLIRNGYVRKAPRKGDDGKQRANDYWILFNREIVKWASDRPARHDESDDDTDATQDVAIPDAPGACGENDIPEVVEAVGIPAGAYGPHAPMCIRNNAEPSKTNPKEGASDFAAAPRNYRPPPFEPQGAVADHEAKQIFVYEGTPAYEAWAKEKGRATGTSTWHLITTKLVEGRQRRGWYFPSLFPPERHATGPPTTPTLSREDEEELADLK